MCYQLPHQHKDGTYTVRRKVRETVSGSDVLVYFIFFFGKLNRQIRRMYTKVSAIHLCGAKVHVTSLAGNFGMKTDNAVITIFANTVNFVP